MEDLDIESMIDEEKQELADWLISQGLDSVYVEWLVFGRDYNDVIGDTNNDT